MIELLRSQIAEEFKRIKRVVPHSGDREYVDRIQERVMDIVEVAFLFADETRLPTEAFRYREEKGQIA